MNQNEDKHQRKKVVAKCCMCDKDEIIAIESIVTNAMLCFKCLGNSLRCLAGQIDIDIGGEK